MSNQNLNIRALRLAYSQFFVNISELSDSELLSVHFKYNEQISQDEDQPWYKIPVGELLVVWEQLEDLPPVTLLDMVLDLYSGIVSEYGFEDPNIIVVNKAEVVEVLSANAVLANGNSINDPEYQEFCDYYQQTLEELAR